MSALSLTLACDLTDRTRALHDGTVTPKGIDLNFVPLSVEEVFWRMLRNQEFHVSEMSMSSFMLAADRGEPDFVAIPAFTSRYFRHSCIFVNTDAGIEEPADLVGKRVGVPEYQMTSPLWIRGILQHEYGVKPSDVQWFHGGEEEEGREEKLPLDLPDDVDLQYIPADDTLSDMLERGDLDAFATARAPSSFFTSPKVERLFPNFREVEAEYYRKTGHFPIMHTVVIRRDVYEENPWVAQELLKAFTEAKDVCLREIGDSSALRAALPWLHDELEQTRELMGEDYWPYGIEANRETLELMTQFSYEQGLSKERHDLEDLFAPETFESFKV